MLPVKGSDGSILVPVSSKKVFGHLQDSTSYLCHTVVQEVIFIEKNIECL